MMQNRPHIHISSRLKGDSDYKLLFHNFNDFNFFGNQICLFSTQMALKELSNYSFYSLANSFYLHVEQFKLLQISTGQRFMLF